MAIDTRKKRQAVASVGMPWMPPAIVPDGSIDLFDRQVIGWGYGGVVAGEVATAGFVCVRNVQIKVASATATAKIANATGSLRC